VKQGQLLAELDTPEIDQELAQALAQRQQTSSSLGLAKSSLERWQQLRQRDAVSQQELDERQSTYTQDVANLAAADANVKRLQQLESFKRIVAPFAGVVTQRNVDVGDLIDAGSGTSRALFALAQSDPLRVYVQLPQAYAQNVSVGQKVVVTQAELPGQQFHGTVTHISGAIDVPTRSLQIEVTLPNPDDKLRPGAYVQVAVPAAAHAELSVPGNALLFRAEGPRIAVVDAKGNVELRKVVIARDLGQTLEIESGIGLDDRIIINPSDSIADGDHVQVTQPQKSGKEAS
jgi:RND family efflux transporter MFP subunit